MHVRLYLQLASSFLLSRIVYIQNHLTATSSSALTIFSVDYDALSLTSIETVNNTNAKFCASFSSEATTGVSGYFAMMIQSGVAKYAFNLDLASLTNDQGCDVATSGLKYHIHSYWMNDTSSSTYGPDYCGSAGGHYDPALACSTSSEYSSSICPAINRTVATGYSYTCSPTIFSAGDFPEW
jgi:hypothetical protein